MPNHAGPLSSSGRPLNAAHYAVVVGINYYRSFTPLSGALNDARRFAEWLVAPSGGGLDPDNVRCVPATEEFSDGDHSRLMPRVGDILDAIADVNEEMRARLRSSPEEYARSRIYIYVAGHGMSAPSVPAALFTVEARQGSWGSALDLRALAHWYEEYGPFAEVVLFADCCRSRFRDVGVIGMPFEKEEMPYRAMGASPRVVTFYATLPDELSYEGPTDTDAHRGVFSAALEQALSDAVSPIGYVTHVSLEANVRARITALTAPPYPQPPQTCQMQASLHPLVVFGPQRLQALVTIAVPVPAGKDFTAGHIELLTSERQLVAASSRDLEGTTWEVRVKSGLYRCQWVDISGAVHPMPAIDTDFRGSSV